MKFIIDMKCGEGSLEENMFLLKSIVETGVLNIRTDFAKKVMPRLERFDFTIKPSLFEKIKKKMSNIKK